VPKAIGYSLFHPETMNKKNPINPEDPVYKYNNTNESIHYLSRIGKGRFDRFMMTLSF
jgi:hypothetical protein